MSDSKAIDTRSLLSALTSPAAHSHAPPAKETNYRRYEFTLPAANTNTTAGKYQAQSYHFSGTDDSGAWADLLASDFDEYANMPSQLVDDDEPTANPNVVMATAASPISPAHEEVGTVQEAPQVETIGDGSRGLRRSRMDSFSMSTEPQCMRDTIRTIAENRWSVLFLIASGVALLGCFLLITPVEEWALDNAVCPVGLPVGFQWSGLIEMLLCETSVMKWQGYLTLGLVVLSCVLIAKNQPPDLVFMGVTVLLQLFGVVKAADAYSGFGSPGVILIAILQVLGCGLERSGALEWLFNKVLGKSRHLLICQVRLLLPVACLSAFMSSTTVVAIMIPQVLAWSKRVGFSKSKFLLPLSCAAMLGGACTILGSPSSLVLQGLLTKYDPHNKLHLFDVAKIGVPCAFLGLMYVAIASLFLADHPGFVAHDAQIVSALGGLDAVRVPVSTPAERDAERRYAVAFELKATEIGGSQLVGESLGDSGLLNVEGVTLVKIVRKNHTVWRDSGNAVKGRDFRLQKGDQLVFTAVPDGIVALRQLRGLVPASRELAKLGRHRRHRRLVEVVLSRSCPLVGRPLGNTNIREDLSAAILACRTIAGHKDHDRDDEDHEPTSHNSAQGSYGSVHHSRKDSTHSRASDTPRRPSSSRASSRQGQSSWVSAAMDPEYRLRPGDSLLLETFPDFVQLHKNSIMFALVHEVEGSAPPRWTTAMDRVRMVVAFLAFVGFLAMSSYGVDAITSGAVAIAVMLAVGVMTVEEAFRSVQARTLFTMIGAFGIAYSINSSGVGEFLADKLCYELKPLGRFGVLSALFFMTAVTSTFVSSAAAAALFYPIAYHAALIMPGLRIQQTLLSILFAACSAFSSPVSNLTHLMVVGPGAYEPATFMKFGSVLQLYMMGSTLAMIYYLPAD